MEQRERSEATYLEQRECSETKYIEKLWWNRLRLHPKEIMEVIN